MNSIAVNNLNFAYGSDGVVFQDARIDMECGRVYLLTGENGSGKTTLMKLMSGMISGGVQNEINWKGSTYNSFTQLKNKILYVNESPYLYDYLTGGENIELLMELFDIRDKKEQVQENLRRFQLEDELNKLVKDYSLGMKYKLFLAAAFVVDVEMILLDEPFSSLDLESQAIAQEMVDLFTKSGGIVLISTHIKDYIEKYIRYHFSINDRRLDYCENK